MIKIIAVNPSTQQPVEIETSVTTWGELKPVLNSKGIETKEYKGMVRQTNVELVRDDAQLPQTDFTLYLFPMKNKAGKCQK